MAESTIKGIFEYPAAENQITLTHTRALSSSKFVRSFAQTALNSRKHSRHTSRRLSKSSCNTHQYANTDRQSYLLTISTSYKLACADLNVYTRRSAEKTLMDPHCVLLQLKYLHFTRVRGANRNVHAPERQFVKV